MVMNDQGELTYPWGESEASAAIVYGTTDAFFGPAVASFLKQTFSLERFDWFQSSAAGLEHPMLQAIGKQAALYTSAHAQSEAIAEWVLWAGLDHFQNGRARRQAQTAHQWGRLGYREISDTHWLIIGFGAIGQAAARRLSALGAEVTGVRRSGATSEHAKRVVMPDDMQPYLQLADAVLLSVPHTPETESLADAAFFAGMKPGALFLNVGRGGLVDEMALLAGLDAGQPGHATLDVMREEPQPADSPFWDREDVTITAHVSASTEQAKLRTDAVFIDNLGRFLAGEDLQHQVPASAFA